MSLRFLWRLGPLGAAFIMLHVPTARGQMPSFEEFEAAAATSAGLAQANGLSLHTDDVWMALARSRAPLMARITARRCQIGYSAYTPGRDFSWLFPEMASPDRQVWLQALVHHELAHCADAVATISRTAAAERPAQRQREAVADLAFALHLDDAKGESADRLIAKLMALRARRAAVDPDHDTAAVLGCYLAHPLRRVESRTRATEWAARLTAWMHRCWPEPDPS